MSEDKTFGERLRFLMDSTGISLPKISAATGVGVPALNNYSQGRIGLPRGDMLVRLADFFAVPLDYLVGRCDRETAEAIQKDYAARFMELRRGPYEMYLAGRNRPERITGNCEAPWPYNLLDDIVGGPASHSGVKWEDRWQEVLSPDQEAGLDAALGSLREVERQCMLRYYRDGRRLEDIGKDYGVTRERIRQVVAKGVRKLRHPSRLNQIRLGLEGAYNRRALALEQKRQALDRLEAELSKREKALTGTGASGAAAVSIEAFTPMEDMELSVRSYNCLKRAGCNTLADVEALVQAGKLPYVRNLGGKSMAEVLGKLEKLTGKRYG